MPAPSYIPNSPSGMDTQKVINDLVAIERIPQRRMEREQAELRAKNAALEELRKYTKRLQDRLKKLYGFEASFESKKLEFSKEGFASGSSAKNATSGEYRLKIHQLAKKLVFKSDAVKTSQVFPAGKISINGREKRFSGGKLENLADFINEYYSDFLTVKYIRPDADNALLVAETVKEGEEALLKMEDPDGILKKAGLIKGLAGTDKPDGKPEDKSSGEMKEDYSDILFGLENFSVVKDGPFQLREDKKGFTISGESARRFDQAPPVQEKKKLKALNLEHDMVPTPPEEKDNAPDKIADGPVDTLNVQGNEIHTYNIEREREHKTVREEEKDYGVILHFPESPSGAANPPTPSPQPDSKDGKKTEGPQNGPLKISLKGKDKLIQIPVDANIKKMDFYTQNMNVTFFNAKWVYEIIPEPEKTDKEKPNIAGQKEQFRNIIQEASNASLELDGIPVERKGNLAIEDLIKGANINLIAPTPQEILVKVTKNPVDSVTQVKEFIEAYNELLKLSHELTKTSEIKAVGEYDKMKQESGILVGNSAIRSLVNGLKFRVADSYPALREPYIKSLPFIGITTGEVGAEWKNISQGYLILDEGKLISMVMENPTAVKEFFGLDSNSDRVIDSGFAFSSHEFLEPYIQFTRGIISSQIDANKTRILALDKEIIRQEAHVKTYEEKLKTKFGNMEGKMRKDKSTGKFIEQRLNNR